MEHAPVNIRKIPTALWHRVKLVAVGRKQTISKFVTKALEAAVNGKRKP
jgi:hypothetical protein